MAPWRASRARELIADRRTAAERRVSDLILAGIIGRTRPGWAGERGEQLLNETAELILPWQVYDD